MSKVMIGEYGFEVGQKYYKGEYFIRILDISLEPARAFDMDSDEKILAAYYEVGHDGEYSKYCTSTLKELEEKLINKQGKLVYKPYK